MWQLRLLRPVVCQRRLEFVRQLLQRPGQKVVAACRNPDNADGLRDLQQQHSGNLSTVALDVTDEDSITAAAESVKKSHGHVNLLLNCAGVLHIPGELSPETSLSRVTTDNLLRTFKINAFGPILVSKAFWPLLAKAPATEDNPTKLFARRKQHIATLLLHPGTVDTDLSQPFQKNVKPEKLFSRERAIKQLLDIIDSATSKDKAKFIAWDGQEIPW
ncbi:hypothetical protein WJX73_010890 [Symbiochloris irregularis]|uniref:Uncharacterized protein n=1 Tax=Symbiochloris irregularis TaxID=706552 RepID=A0AAW1P2U3_9CHLO